MTDLSLTQALLTDDVPSNIFSLKLGIFVLWKISLIRLKRLTRINIVSRPNDRRQWLHKGKHSLLKNRTYSQLFDAPILSDENTLNADAWLQELTMHYLGAEPIIQSTHYFLRILKQDANMSSHDWQTAVRLSIQKCNFPVDAADRCQRNIFVVRLNDIEAMQFREKPLSLFRLLK